MKWVGQFELNTPVVENFSKIFQLGMNFIFSRAVIKTSAQVHHWLVYAKCFEIDGQQG